MRKLQLWDIADKIYKAKREEIPLLWKKFFYQCLANWGFNIKSRKDLFEWDIGENWADLHKENTGYKDENSKQLLESFRAEVSYISDRTTLCRLFRAHWLFCQAYDKEVSKSPYFGPKNLIKKL